MKGSDNVKDNSIGAILRRERRNQDLTLKDLGKLTGLKESHISAVEHDRISPSLKAFLKICIALEIEDITFCLKVFKEELKNEQTI